MKSIDENWKVMFGKGLIRHVLDLVNFGKSIKNNLKEFNDEKYKEGEQE
jgi:hypothetical protein